MTLRAGLAVQINPQPAITGAAAAGQAMAGLRAQAQALARQLDGVAVANDNLGRVGARQVGVLQQLGTGYSRAASAALGLRGAVAGVVAVLGVREILAYAESWALVEGRLRLVTRTAADVARAQDQLFDVAQRSRQGFEATADVYSRMARNAKDLGLSQLELLGITEAINQAFIVSGASAEASKAALVQLGQAFASGTLRGEELNSVLEQAPRLAEAIAVGMGKTVGQLRALGAEGKLTAKAVADALLSQRQAIEREFSTMPTTVAQATATVTNSIARLVGQLDSAVGFSRALASGLQAVSGWLDRIAESGGPAATLAELERAVAGYRADLERIPAGTRDPVLRDRRRFAAARLVAASSDRDMLADDLRRLDRLARQRDATPLGDGGASTATAKSQDVLRDLQHERDLLQQTARERAISNALKKAEIDLNAELSPAQRAVAEQIAATAAALHDHNVVVEASNQLAEIATAQAQEHEKALLAAKERTQDLLRAQDERLRDLKEEAALAREEVNLLGLSEREREVELRLRQEINRERREGLPLSEQEIALRKREIETIVAARETVRKSQEIVAVSEDIADSLIDNFRRARDEGESLIKRMADSILATLEDLAFAMAKQVLVVPITPGLLNVTGRKR
jgi:tape measure domain-containing protein